MVGGVVWVAVPPVVVDVVVVAGAGVSHVTTTATLFVTCMVPVDPTVTPADVMGRRLVRVRVQVVPVQMVPG